MSFNNPLALVLLITLPVLALVGWPRRGLGFRRELISLILRLLIAACLVLSAAGASIDRQADRLAVVFLIDVSDSMSDADVLAAEDYVHRSIQSMKADDTAAVIAFGGDALVERPMSPSRDLLGLTSIPFTNQTDISEAMQLALALYPPGAARRMVILTDAADTVTGQAAEPGGSRLYETARLVRESGVDLLVVPFVSQSGPEVLLSDVSTPGFMRQGESFNLDLTIESSEKTTVNITVLAGDRVVFEGQQVLEPGKQTYSLPLQAGEPGFVQYRVQISGVDDTYYQNNELAAYAEVEGPPKVLVVAPAAGEPMGFQGEIRPDELSSLLAALEATNFVVETALPSELSADLVELNEYSSVILVDVPARQFSQRQMLALQQYVRDLGGGLVTVGGPTSYGVGGYFRTPLEDTLPVDMQIKDQQRRPTLTMVFIIDHSGSMSDVSGGVQKMELAKEAAIRSLELLSPTDRVGVIAFDDSASWVVEITGMENMDSVANAIGTIRSDGGTDIMSGVLAMSTVLPDDPSSVKHVILLTDGGADPTGISELISQMYNDYGITLSTVGVGSDAAPFLADLAAAGGGRYHFAADPSTIPSIFTEETTLATRSYIMEEEFFPLLSSSSPIMAGISETPPLYGYVGTSIKDTAQAILVSPEGDPILATWQYGLGKAVSFTSDATGRWAKDWVPWEGFPQIWSQIVEYTLASKTPSSLEVSVENEGDQAALVVDAYELSGGTGLYLNEYEMEANVISPGGEVFSATLRQVAPGRYETSFTPTEEGAYLIRVTGSSPDQTTVAATTGWVLSYSPEYRNLDPDPDQAIRLAAAAGGRVASGDPVQVFEHNLSAQRARNPIGLWLLTLAAILLPLDIAVRRLILTPADLIRAGRRSLEKLSQQLTRSSRPTEDSAKRAAGMQVLFQAKERSKEIHPRPASPPPEIAVKPAPPVEKPSPTPVKPAAPAASAEKPSPKKPDGASTAARLLEQKRKRGG